MHDIMLITIHQQIIFFSGAVFPGLFMCKETLKANILQLSELGEDSIQFSLEHSMVVINFISRGGHTISLYIDCSHYSRGRIKPIVPVTIEAQIIELPSGKIDYAVSNKYRVPTVRRA